MPYDSEGNFTRVHNWEEDRQNDIDIMSDRMDEEFDNYADGLNSVMLRDGRCVMNGNLRMGNYQIKQLANGTASTDAVAKNQLDTVNSNLNARINDVLATLYPVGSLYIGTQETCPISTLISGSVWELVSAGRALWTSDGTNANTTIEAGLPNITGKFSVVRRANWENEDNGGAFKRDSTWSAGVDGSTTGDNWGGKYSFDASRSSELYGASETVQPPAYIVNVWRRTA